jgi:hypothetical protein
MLLAVHNRPRSFRLVEDEDENEEAGEYGVFTEALAGVSSVSCQDDVVLLPIPSFTRLTLSPV